MTIEASDQTAEAAAHNPPPRLRSDAERNRRRVMEAAACAFAEAGFEVSIDEIARRAGLGKGTVFRRFPTKEDLVAAIVCERMGELLEVGAQLSASDDPGEALRAFMRRMVEILCGDRGLLEAIHGLASTDEEVLSLKHEVSELAWSLLVRAQEQGSIRTDIAADDVLLLVAAVSHVSAPFHDVDADLWQRYFDLMFDGLRSEAARPCSHPAPTEEQLAAASGCAVPAFRGSHGVRTGG